MFALVDLSHTDLQVADDIFKGVFAHEGFRLTQLNCGVSGSQKDPTLQTILWRGRHRFELTRYLRLKPYCPGGALYTFAAIVLLIVLLIVVQLATQACLTRTPMDCQKVYI